MFLEIQRTHTHAHTHEGRDGVFHTPYSTPTNKYTETHLQMYYTPKEAYGCLCKHTFIVLHLCMQYTHLHKLPGTHTHTGAEAA